MGLPVCVSEGLFNLSVFEQSEIADHLAKANMEFHYLPSKAARREGIRDGL